MLDKTVEDGDVTGDEVFDVLGGALSFSLKDASKFCGNVWPFSQMSTSFLIFSYTQQKSYVSFHPYNDTKRRSE